ncbi:hypothetical protein N6H14_29070 [Paenibacillus sp. CC-CFT747]|nr:hypothetical protein N6H14_29070 [Paenibacillus sp. CC-CFT747]
MIQRRKKLFLTLWFSYLLILFIPVSIFAVLYTNIEQLMVKNANRSNLAMLEQARQAVDTQMQEINRLTSQIATQPKLQTLWNIRENDRYVEYSEAVNILKNIRSGSTFAGNYYIQLAESDLILSPSLKTDTSTYLNKISTYADKDEAWVRSHVLSGYHFQTFWPSASIIENSLIKNVITCAVSLPLGESANVRATLVILIDEEQIFNILKQIEWASSGRIYILDDHNQVIMSSVGDRTLPEGVLPEVSGSPQYRTIELDGNSMMLSSTAGTSGWKYLSLVPEEVVLKRVNQIKQWAYLVLAAALAAGSAAAGWMAYRNYSPIRDMVTALLNGRSETAPISGNEYEFIQSSITATLAEGKQLKQRLEEHTPVVRAHFLTRLLKGQADPDAFKESSLEFMGLRFPYDGICVVLIEVDDLSEFGKEDTEREWALARFILINLSSELIGDSGYVTETDRNRFAILMNVEDDSEETRLRRDEFVSQLKQVVEGRFRLKITAAASSIRMGLPEAGRCYAEALEALDYRIIHGISSYIHFDEIRQPGGGSISIRWKPRSSLRT